MERILLLIKVKWIDLFEEGITCWQLMTLMHIIVSFGFSGVSDMVDSHK